MINPSRQTITARYASEMNRLRSIRDTTPPNARVTINDTPQVMRNNQRRSFIERCTPIASRIGRSRKYPNSRKKKHPPLSNTRVHSPGSTGMTRATSPLRDVDSVSCTGEVYPTRRTWVAGASEYCSIFVDF